MAHFIDTNIAIDLRDGDQRVAAAIAALDDVILMSIVTRVELEGGVYRDPFQAGVRKARLAVLLDAIPVTAFDDASATAYAAICASAGYSRRKLLDRMIAAQAIVHRASLITRNPDDFADIDGLIIVAW